MLVTAVSSRAPGGIKFNAYEGTKTLICLFFVLETNSWTHYSLYRKHQVKQDNKVRLSQHEKENNIQTK